MASVVILGTPGPISAVSFKLTEIPASRLSLKIGAAHSRNHAVAWPITRSIHSTFCNRTGTLPDLKLADRRRQCPAGMEVRKRFGRGTGIGAAGKGGEEPAADETAVLTFYTHGLCPYAQRVALTLAEKGIAHEYVHIDLANKPRWYFQVNRSGLVPAIVHNGQTVVESIDICRYINETFPGPALMPSGAAERRAAEEAIARCDAFIHAGFGFIAGPTQRLWSVPTGRAGDARCGREREAFERELRFLEEVLRRSGGPFLMGSTITLVDLIFFPFLDRFELALDAFRNFSIAKWNPSSCAKAPAIGEYILNMRSRGSWMGTSTNPKALVAAYRRFGCMDYFDYSSATLECPNP